MATVTISLPDRIKDRIDEVVDRGVYDSASDYIFDLVERDLEKESALIIRGAPLEPETLEEMREIIAQSEASGISEKTVHEIFDEVLEAHRHRRAAQG